MIEYQKRSEDPIGLVFSALADPTRRRIIERLREGEATIGALAEPIPMSFAAVSKHVQILEHAGLLRRNVHGREHRLTLDAAPLLDATRWTLRYRSFWNDRLDALDRVLRLDRSDRTSKDGSGNRSRRKAAVQPTVNPRKKNRAKRKDKN